MKTTAVVFPEPDKFELVDLTLEEPGPGDIVVRTLVSSISPGTERWILRGKHIGSVFPCVPGYHRIGIVEKCGKDVRDLEEGDVVYGSGGRWTDKIHSMWGAHVGLSVSEPGWYRFMGRSVPDRFELETTVFAILAGVANRGLRFLDVRPDERLLVIGAGIIGVCAAQLAGLRGAHAVLLEVDRARAEFLRPLVGAVVDPTDPSAGEHLKELAPDGFDLLYDTVGDAATTDRMVQQVKRHGRMLLQAQYFDKERCALDLDQIKLREITVKTTCGTDSLDWFDTVENIRHRRLKIGPLITHRFGSEDALKGYELLHSGTPLNLGIVFFWDGTLRG
ncbi:zinc-binding dehydrogenase [Verrucomicrobiota bacterium]